LLAAGRFELALADVSVVAGKRDGGEAERLNMIELFLMEQATRLELPRYGLSDANESVLLTPQDGSAKCVVFLVMAKGGSPPLLAVKLPRLALFGDRVVREAANLEAVQSIRSSGFETIPRLIACDEVNGRPVLVQTALVGRALDPVAVRSNGDRAVAAVLGWLGDISEATQAPADSGWYERLLALPLNRLDESRVVSEEDSELISRTRQLLEPLRASGIPSVLEHGDLSHPNIIQLANGRIGVVDWELTELHGVPTHDLFFFLAYVAFAKSRASRLETRIAAFDDAFIHPDGWAKSAVETYAQRAGIDSPLLTPLFIACWARYTAGLLSRLGEPEDGFGRTSTLASTYIERTWYRALWQHAVANANRLVWDGS
jgi:hypothetical protein